jgi:Ion channel
MRWLWTALPGICLVVLTFREIFHALFHPTETGSFSDFAARTIFKAFRHRPSALAMAGPLSVVVVILCWALGQSLGFALIYWAGFPDKFQLSTPEQTRAAGGFWTMFYFSLQMMTSLGLGDVVAKANWIRLICALQALVGFGLLTASVSSIVLIYPALSRMRCLARRTANLLKAAQQTGIDVVSGDVEQLLGSLALDVVRTRVDLIHFPIIYYFHSEHPRSSLAHALPALLGFVERGLGAESSERVRLASGVLQAALEDLAHVLSDRFVNGDRNNTVAVFRAYAEDHLCGDPDK